MSSEDEKEKKETPETNQAPAPAAEEVSKEKQYWDQLLRLKADYENLKKRLQREKEEAIRFANERLLLEVLPIVDNMDRAMASLSEGHDPAKVKEGLRIAQDELHEILEQHGVAVVNAVGGAFDPSFHEAVGAEETNDVKEGTVLSEIQRGYLLNGRLLRPSRVKIAKKEEKT